MDRLSFILLNRSVFTTLVLFLSLVYWHSKTDPPVKSTLFIGITSSPDHYQQRMSLRDTWLQSLPDSYHFRFLVGEEMCNVHPLDRKSQFTCIRLNLSIPNSITEHTLLFANSKTSEIVEQAGKPSIGFSFHVHHPIALQFLGVKADLKAGSGLVRVLLKDSTSFIISSATFDGEALQKSVKNNGFIYKRLKHPVILPKDFEGSVEVKGLAEESQVGSISKCVEFTNISLFSVLEVMNNSTENSKNHCVLSTFSFTIIDLDDLRSHAKGSQMRMEEWENYTQKVSEDLVQEAIQHNDILFLKMVDVYRSLPKKVLLFLMWLYKTYSVKYVLKTDDDTFIDISALKKELDTNSKWDWWSCFRIGWPVQKFGKWRETGYQKEIYPPFPSGAGYVLSEHVLAWLVKRADQLSVDYQGEDVAVGIWLETLNALRHVGRACYWACSEQYHENTCNVIQLSVQEIYQVWEKYKACSNKICLTSGP